MIEALKTWIITLSVAIVFSTAVQLILPDNSLKKYCKFVLGLIVFVVMLNPIVKIFDKNLDINNYISLFSSSSYEETFEKDIEGYRKDNLSKTISVFKNNLETNCVEKLKKQFGDKNFRAEAKIKYDSEENLPVIEAMEIGVRDGTIRKIEDVNIKEDSIAVQSKNELKSVLSEKIKEYVSNTYDISNNSVYVYDENS